MKALTFFLKLCFSFFVGLLMLEIVLRLYNPLPFAVRRGKVILPANKQYVFMNKESKRLEPVIYVRKNSLGLRGEEPSENFTDRLTIIAVGGSTTECSTLTDGKTWTDQLSIELKKTFPDVWINNAGIPGHSTFGHLLLMEDYILKLHPKVITFLVGINDVEVPSFGKYDTNMLKGHVDTYSTKAFLQSIARNVEVLTLASNLVQLYIARSRNLGLHDWDFAKVPVVPMTDSEIQVLVDRNTKEFIPSYRDRIKKLDAMCRENQILPIFITQPALYGPIIDDVTGVDFGKIQADGQEHRPGIAAWKVLELYNDVLRDLAKQDELLVIDLAHALPKSSRYFHDFAHFTNEGAVEVSRILAPEMTEIIQDHVQNKKNK